MGLLKHLLFWPVTGPLFLAEFALGKVDGVVRDELTDDQRIRAELLGAPALLAAPHGVDGLGRFTELWELQ